jgi:hypothetical protein
MISTTGVPCRQNMVLTSPAPARRVSDFSRAEWEEGIHIPCTPMTMLAFLNALICCAKCSPWLRKMSSRVPDQMLQKYIEGRVLSRTKAGAKLGLHFIHIQDFSHAHAFRAVVAVNGAVLALAAGALNEQHAPRTPVPAAAVSCACSGQQLPHSGGELSWICVVHRWRRRNESDTNTVPHARSPGDDTAAKSQKVEGLRRPRVAVPRVYQNAAIFVTFHPLQRQLQPRQSLKHEVEVGVR